MLCITAPSSCVKVFILILVLVFRTAALHESKNYYNIAHALKEDVKEQPSILVGGTLKEYQVS